MVPTIHSWQANRRGVSSSRAKLVRAGITTKSTKPLRSPAKLDLADRERTFADNAVRKWKIELTMV